MECPACHTPNVDGARFCAKCGALLPSESTEASDPLIGAIVGGRFRITGILGEGGMGRVYTGEQQMGTSVRKVAVKTLLAQYAKDPQVLARFMRECGTVSELEHPNTIKVYDFGQTNTGELYIAMELLTGESLEKALEGGPLPPERVDRILAQVSGSLQEAHEKGIVHRDLKPANIYLTTRAGEEDCVKVLDFGIAKRDDKHSKQEAKLTQQGTVLGTPPYMSPEQFRGQELDMRSDIYSLGVMTYEMLTGRLPFDADTPWAWATQHMTAQPFPFETIALGGQVPAKMKAAVMRALAKDMTLRQQSVREYFDEFSLGNARTSALSAPRQSLVDGGSRGVAPSPNGYPGPSPLQTQAAGASYPGGQPDWTASSPQIAGYGSSPALPVAGSEYAGAPAFGGMPTGGGQAFPTPATQGRKGGGVGPFLAVAGAIVLVAGVVGTVVYVKQTEDPAHSGGSSTATTRLPTIATSVPSLVPDAGLLVGTPQTDAGTGKGSGHADRDCQLAEKEAGANHVIAAATHFRACEGARKGLALAAIDKAAQASALRGCTSMEEARAANAAGAPAALRMLERQHCPTTPVHPH